MIKKLFIHSELIKKYGAEAFGGLTWESIMRDKENVIEFQKGAYAYVDITDTGAIYLSPIITEGDYCEVID